MTILYLACIITPFEDVRRKLLMLIRHVMGVVQTKAGQIACRGSHFKGSCWYHFHSPLVSFQDQLADQSMARATLEVLA